jgi:hypothetical protein
MALATAEYSLSFKCGRRVYLFVKPTKQKRKESTYNKGSGILLQALCQLLLKINETPNRDSCRSLEDSVSDLITSNRRSLEPTIN